MVKYRWFLKGGIHTSSKAVFHVTVKGVILHHGKMLILRKVEPSKDAFGYWELPGGGMEYNETPVEAMKREVREETGLDVQVIRPLSTFHVGRADKQIVGIIFLCETTSDKVQLSNEHTDYLFVTESEIKDYLHPKIITNIFNQGQFYFNKD